MQETCSIFSANCLNRCYATSRHNTFIPWYFAASLCVTTPLFDHSPTFTPGTAIKEEKSFMGAVGSRGYIMLGYCWPAPLTLGYCPAVRSLQLCLGSQLWTLPLRFKCLSPPISKVLTATIHWWYKKKSYLTLNIRLRLWTSIYPRTQIGWNEFNSLNFLTDYFVEIEF